MSDIDELFGLPDRRANGQIRRRRSHTHFDGEARSRFYFAQL